MVNREQLITDSLRTKNMFVLKRFECSSCKQQYVYIVDKDTEYVVCNICNVDMRGRE